MADREDLVDKLAREWVKNGGLPEEFDLYVGYLIFSRISDVYKWYKEGRQI
jgi:hypothetical protein